MCISREHFNLCGCGCPEINHEEPGIVEALYLDRAGLPPRGRGKCFGQIPLMLSIEEVRKLIDEARERGEERVSLTKPCECTEFKPVFKNMCGGF